MALLLRSYIYTILSIVFYHQLTRLAPLVNSQLRWRSEKLTPGVWIRGLYPSRAGSVVHATGQFRNAAVRTAAPVPGALPRRFPWNGSAKGRAPSGGQARADLQRSRERSVRPFTLHHTRLEGTPSGRQSGNPTCRPANRRGCARPCGAHAFADLPVRAGHDHAHAAYADKGRARLRAASARRAGRTRAQGGPSERLWRALAGLPKSAFYCRPTFAAHSSTSLKNRPES